MPVYLVHKGVRETACGGLVLRAGLGLPDATPTLAVAVEFVVGRRDSPRGGRLVAPSVVPRWRPTKSSKRRAAGLIDVAGGEPSHGADPPAASPLPIGRAQLGEGQEPAPSGGATERSGRCSVRASGKAEAARRRLLLEVLDESAAGREEPRHRPRHHLRAFRERDRIQRGRKRTGNRVLWRMTLC